MYRGHTNNNMNNSQNEFIKKNSCPPLFSVEICVCLDFKAFCSWVTILSLSQLRKLAPVVFAVGRGGSKSEELLVVLSTLWAHFATEVPLAVACVW